MFNCYVHSFPPTISASGGPARKIDILTKQEKALSELCSLHALRLIRN